MSTNSTSTPIQRIGLFAAALGMSILATLTTATTLAQGDHILNGVVLTIFFVLTFWIAFWFVVASVGFWRLWRQTGRRDAPPSPDDATPPLPRTAILLPVYNEDPEDVSARLGAIADSIRDAGHADDFDFFILSDSTNPDVWLAEERAFLRLKNELAPAATYYRHRNANIGRKSGNIADFCMRWGAGYRYMVVLDADSLMTGRVLAELVRRMEADPHLGILQTPPLPLGDRSLVSRRQQFCSKLCGPMFVEGLAWAAGDGGNYWGHNAIIRTAAFTQHCGLGKLPGVAPLGGEILSHDFVEAALMRRAGFKVQLAADLTESYEQTPTTLPDFAQRDLRWCQGNLQHARLAVSRHIPLANRLHLEAGVLAYASSLLWLLFLLVWPLAYVVSHNRQAAEAEFFERPLDGDHGLWIFAAVMAMLVAPLVGGVVLALRRGTADGFGGGTRLVRSTVCEFLASVALAPIMMAFHSLFILSTLCGRSVKWQTQHRTGRGVSWAEAWRVHGWQSVGGVLLASFLGLVSPSFLLWVSPVLVSLIAAVPISVAMSSPALGERLRRRGLLETPEERWPPAIVQSFHEKQDEQRRRPDAKPAALFEELLLDPAWLRLHLAALTATGSEEEAPQQIVKRSRSAGVGKRVGPDERRGKADPAVRSRRPEKAASSRLDPADAAARRRRSRRIVAVSRTP